MTDQPVQPKRPRGRPRRDGRPAGSVPKIKRPETFGDFIKEGLELPCPTSADTTDTEEAAYVRGEKAVWRSLLSQCIRELGVDDPDAARVRWLVERRDTIATLREWCGQYGDNDWSDDLRLSDVIERHLMRDVAEALDKALTP